jgi:predicted TIM-barrel fold metal-dependent hydrolase
MLLPDPSPRGRIYPVISVDDHLHEPPHVFDGRMPVKFEESAPKLVETSRGAHGWLYEGKVEFALGQENVVGRAPDSWSREPLRREEVRPGSWDINARVADMDIDGVYAQVCFPSGAFGFGGRRFADSTNQELGLAAMRAYNGWHIEELAGTHPGRIIPMQLVWLTDPEIGAAEIRANADKGFKAATMPDLPQHLGLPRIQDPYWQPVLSALEETDTVLCLHLGAGSWVIDPMPDRNGDVSDTDSYAMSALFPASSMVTAVEWTFSGVMHRFPRLKVALSEGGIGWVPMLIDRLNFMLAHSGSGLKDSWTAEETPAQTLVRHFWYCMIDNPSNLDAVGLIGSDHIMVETDYPHADSTWPDSQKLLESRFAGLPVEDALNMAYRSAERLFKHPLPESWLKTTRIHAASPTL